MIPLKTISGLLIKFLMIDLFFQTSQHVCHQRDKGKTDKREGKALFKFF